MLLFVEQEGGPFGPGTALCKMRAFLLEQDICLLLHWQLCWPGTTLYKRRAFLLEQDVCLLIHCEPCCCQDW